MSEIDGTGEGKLVVKKIPHNFASSGCAWSQDGAHLAALVQCSESGLPPEIVVFGADDG